MFTSQKLLIQAIFSLNKQIRDRSLVESFAKKKKKGECDEMESGKPVFYTTYETSIGLFLAVLHKETGAKIRHKS